MSEVGLVSFGDALKTARRMIYKYPNVWRVGVICFSPDQAKYAYDEAKRTFEQGSLRIIEANRSTMQILTERGGIFYFPICTSGERTRGMQFTQLVWLAGVKDSVKSEVRTSLRSQHVPPMYLTELNSTL